MNNQTSVSFAKNRFYYLDFLRVLSAFAVICIHFNGMKCSAFQFGDFESMPYIVVYCFSGFAVPTFFMISGVLFLDNSKKITVKRLFTKNIIKHFICWILWLCIYALFYYIFNRDNIMDFDMFIDRFVYHLWFLPILIGIYIFIPLIRCVTSHKNMIEYFLVIAILPSVILFSLNLFITLKEIKHLYSSFILCDKMKYIMYFILGHYIHTYGLKRKMKIFVIIAGITSFFISLLIIGISYYKGSEFYQNIRSNFIFTTFFEGLFVFCIVKHIFNKYCMKEKVLQIIVFLSKYTLGIYVVHVLVIHVLNYFPIEKIIFFHFAISPLVSPLIIFIISFIISFILHRIPIVNKYLV